MATVTIILQTTGEVYDRDLEAASQAAQASLGAHSVLATSSPPALTWTPPTTEVDGKTVVFGGEVLRSP